jgi:hypothetical protein
MICGDKNELQKKVKVKDEVKSKSAGFFIRYTDPS